MTLATGLSILFRYNYQIKITYVCLTILGDPATVSSSKKVVSVSDSEVHGRGLGDGSFLDPNKSSRASLSSWERTGTVEHRLSSDDDEELGEFGICSRAL